MSTIERLIKKVDEKKQRTRDLSAPDASGQSDDGNLINADIVVSDQNKVASKELPDDLVIKSDTIPKISADVIQKNKTIKLDPAHLAEAGVFMPENSTDQFKKEFRSIKRPILTNAFGKSASLVDRGNLIMVTSSLPGEGKTFTAINLALSIAAEKDHTVLLVDADVAKSDLTKLFDLSNEPGLSDLLLDESLSISDVLIKTDIPDLTLLPSGVYHQQMTELLASQRMTRLVNELGERYADRAVIFDTPPILATSEAQLLAGMSGQIAYVVQAGKTPQYVVKEGISTLNRDSAIGLILNRTQNLLGSGSGNSYYNNYTAYRSYGSKE